MIKFYNQLSAKFTTENVIKCSFSMNANCFEDEPSEFRQIGKELFQPSPLLTLKIILITVLPEWVPKLIPVP